MRNKFNSVMLKLNCGLSIYIANFRYWISFYACLESLFAFISVESLREHKFPTWPYNRVNRTHGFQHVSKNVPKKILK